MRSGASWRAMGTAAGAAAALAATSVPAGGATMYAHGRRATRGFSLAAAAAGRTYRGRTSQNEPFTITTANGMVTKLDVGVVDECADYSLSYSDDTDQSLPISGGHFSDSFSGVDSGVKFTVTLHGGFVGGRVVGTLTDTTQQGGSVGKCIGTVSFGRGHIIQPPFKAAYAVAKDPTRPGAIDLKQILLKPVPRSAVVDDFIYSPSFKGRVTLKPKVSRNGTEVTLTFKARILMTKRSELVLGLYDRLERGVERVRAYRVIPSVPALAFAWQRCEPANEVIDQLLGRWGSSEPPVTVPCT
jgi:hypothetical protein